MNVKLQDKYLIYAIEILIVVIIFTGNSYSSSDTLAFIGSILGSLLGVLGACLIFSRQVNNDKKNKQDVILELLSYTLSKTEYLLDGYTDEAINVIKKEGTKRNWTKEEIIKLIKVAIIGIVGSVDSDDNLKDKHSIVYYKVLEMEEKSLNGDNRELKDLHKLVYYKNWQDSILYIDSKFREAIITWILYLEETKDIFDGISDDEVKINYKIYQFIEIREDIVRIMNQVYKSDKKFSTLTEIMERHL
ncbi:MAG: hypothetical protein ACRCXT_06465 [Paraclostridium sp.]